MANNWQKTGSNCMIGFEEKRWMALILNQAADALGHACNVVDEMARRDIETVRSSSEAADLVIVDGADVIKALRTLAMRYER